MRNVSKDFHCAKAFSSTSLVHNKFKDMLRIHEMNHAAFAMASFLRQRFFSNMRGVNKG